MAAEKSNSLDVETIARLLMIGPERVRQLSKDGWIPKVGRGRYPLAGSVQGYISFLKDEQRRASKVAADSEIKLERARGLKLRNDRDEGRLIEVEEALGTLDEIVGELRTGIAAVPARVTRDLDFRDQIEKEIDACFARISKRLERTADRFETAVAASARSKPDKANKEDDA